MLRANSIDDGWRKHQQEKEYGVHFRIFQFFLPRVEQLVENLRRFTSSKIALYLFNFLGYACLATKGYRKNPRLAPDLSQPYLSEKHHLRLYSHSHFYRNHTIFDGLNNSI